ncbi:MAG: hypothetical protein ACHREM_00110 [Polyangiales bacterium]
MTDEENENELKRIAFDLWRGYFSDALAGTATSTDDPEAIGRRAHAIATVSTRIHLEESAKAPKAP